MAGGRGRFRGAGRLGLSTRATTSTARSTSTSSRRSVTHYSIMIVSDCFRAGDRVERRVRIRRPRICARRAGDEVTARFAPPGVAIERISGDDGRLREMRRATPRVSRRSRC